jgi:hypothetical protein
MTTATRRAPALPKLTEKMVTEQVIGWLRSKQWTCERSQSGLFAEKGKRGEQGKKIRIGKKGINDWNCFKGSRYFKLELKAPGKTLSEDQEKYFAECKRGKLCIMWADSLGSFLAKFEIEPWSIEQ